MITKIYEIPIDIDKGVLINRIIKVVTQDLGTNMIRFKFVKDGRVPVDLTGTIVRLIAKSRSGSTIQQECVIENAIEGVVTITLKQSMFAEDGTYIAELQISDSSTQSIRLTTPTFNYFSRKSLQDDDVVVAGDDYSILQDLMNDLAGIDVVIMQGKLDALESQLNENTTDILNKAIVESGTNSNGSYVKYGDGTAFCWRVYSINLNNDGPVISTVIFPVALIAPISSMGGIVRSTSDRGNASAMSNITVGSLGGSWRVLVGNVENESGSPAGTLPVELFAIGRWR